MLFAKIKEIILLWFARTNVLPGQNHERRRDESGEFADPEVEA
jgi:hypothetical protein